ncbi:2-oxo acid dehydrogenase subunit E2 [Halieaceae bacterium IMCC8485]|jgi:pyruvate/2-oxoglutarate dehydrogenase complex dihydrolipoamide acyltransferase (E2) component|uniref:Dihydrolipoamide acetyltransferase component of pyruvate dehydrogenase complex n=1 Tax=Candidatus Seongchinamella marina TaxID=2518990 RepID=A0ABT3SRV6_9GAMM|nr:dihydrolipoamide acetyltransferase family protein [Candidatus Seongchinamella marina]MCX2972077.1 2-oxo acid dehydrogenase subunit E2 [Candidatus Seongchinamella marina]
MAIDYTMPKLAMAMNEGVINQWLVEEGAYVEKGQDLATVETEKVAYDVESPEAGYFHILVAEGEAVPCDTLIAQFAETEEELATLQSSVNTPAAVSAEQAAPVAASSTPQLSNSPARVIASPLARRLARDANLDLHTVIGSGPGGRIVKRDVLPLIAALQIGDAVIARMPFTGMRKTIADRMTASLQSTAQLSGNWESDITAMMAFRQEYVRREAELGTRISVNALIARAMAYAIKQVPVANSCLENDEIVIYRSINLGIAVSVPGASEYDSGLMVGVVHGIENMGLAELDLSMKAMVERLRSGQATAEDTGGATITLSSTAGVGPPGLTSTPVLNSPNTALVGPSTPIERPVVVDGEMCVRTLMPVSFTFDHRVMDGEPAARFMRALHDCLEHPELMMA